MDAGHKCASKEGLCGETIYVNPNFFLKVGVLVPPHLNFVLLLIFDVKTG